MRSEVMRISHELQAQKDKIKENTEKIKVNKTLPYLVSNVIEVCCHFFCQLKKITAHILFAFINCICLLFKGLCSCLPAVCWLVMLYELCFRHRSVVFLDIWISFNVLKSLLL